MVGIDVVDPRIVKQEPSNPALIVIFVGVEDAFEDIAQEAAQVDASLRCLVVPIGMILEAVV